MRLGGQAVFPDHDWLLNRAFANHDAVVSGTNVGGNRDFVTMIDHDFPAFGRESYNSAGTKQPLEGCLLALDLGLKLALGSFEFKQTTRTSADGLNF